MKTNNKICGAILVVAGCILFNIPNIHLFRYAIILNVIGLSMILVPLIKELIPRVSNKAKSIGHELVEEIERQNT